MGARLSALSRSSSAAPSLAASSHAASSPAAPSLAASSPAANSPAAPSPAAPSTAAFATAPRVKAPQNFLDLLALPRPLVLTIFAMLPVDTRLRCCEVSRAWRALLADTTLFSSLNLSVNSGVARFSLYLLHAAAAKAGGQLRALDVTGQRFEVDELHDQPYIRPLLDVVRANAATLTELRLDTDVFLVAEELQLLLEEVTALLLLAASVEFDADHQLARAMLRNEPPYQALRLRRLWMPFQGLTASDVVTFCPVWRCHTSIEDLELNLAALNTAAAMRAVVDACIALRLRRLDLFACEVVPVVLPELTRLVTAGALRELKVNNSGVDMFDEAPESTRLFVAAVRASAMTRLELVLGRNLPVVNALVVNAPEIVVEAAAFINSRQQ